MLTNITLQIWVEALKIREEKDVMPEVCIVHPELMSKMKYDIPNQYAQLVITGDNEWSINGLKVRESSYMEVDKYVLTMESEVSNAN